MDSILDEVSFRIKRAGEDLAIAVVQDHLTKEVLMTAFINKEALRETLSKGTMHYFSTSRKKIWHKGEESGHHQEVKEIFLDCDGDALLFSVVQKGAACHEGYYTCFFRKLKDNRWSVVKKKMFDPKAVYKD